MLKIMREQIIKRVRLLDMLYRPSEIAGELGITAETVTRSYMAAGAPFERDKAGDIWIHGLSMAAWIDKVVHERKLEGGLADGEAFCLRCRAAVMLQRPRRVHEGRYTAIYQGKCPQCGGKVNRAYSAAADAESLSREQSA
jgi:hypothetical protein